MNTKNIKGNTRLYISTQKLSYLTRKKYFVLATTLILASLTVCSLLFLISAEAIEKKCNPDPKTFRHYKNFPTGMVVPETLFLTSNGAHRSLKDYKGKGLVVNFWATWCAPCIREMPQLNHLAALVKSHQIEVLTISEDRNGKEIASKYLKRNKFHNLPGLSDINGLLFRKFNLKGLPSTILINKDGIGIGIIIGITEWDSPDSIKFIRKCLGK